MVADELYWGRVTGSSEVIPIGRVVGLPDINWLAAKRGVDSRLLLRRPEGGQLE